jgi:putative acetyltransferase
MALRIRTARVADRERLLEIWERSVRATHHFLEDTDVISLKPLVAEELASDAVAWWVLASPADEPLGFLGYANDTVEALFIDPDHRGKGGGRLLVEQAQRLSAGTLAVDVNEQNERALGFYEALGFAVVDRSPTDSAGRPFPILHMKRAVPATLVQRYIIGSRK